MKVSYIPIPEIRRIREKVKDPLDLCQLLANIFRLNTLSMVMEAGSGHPGTCFSCLDIITWLWTQEMKSPNQKEIQDSDIFFSSKGHDAPAFYSLLIGLERLDYNFIHKLRRLGGLPGHPDIHTPNILTNTGSLGMGISKARGMAMANRLNGKSGHIYVLCGDGELQEGQIWESLQPTANHKFSEITVIVDHNKIQSDTWVKETSDLGLLEEKFKAFGWEVARCNGHDFNELQDVFKQFRTVKDRPQILIADTVKGKGASLMEFSTEDNKGQYYQYHSGAPSYEVYQKSLDELIEKINKKLEQSGQENINIEYFDLPQKEELKNPQKLIQAYSEELVKIGEENKDVVVLDADLAKDCGLLPFKEKFPKRFFECGIAEQDMVSMAGGLALQGKVPIVHSFACFLSTRANEHIYNNATEKTKIIYTASLAGILPAAPGHSHQSVRDISILGSIPGLTIIEPSCEKETRLALRWAVEKNSFSTYIRLVSIPCELPYNLPDNYQLTAGQGIKLVDGNDAVIFAYGPVMLAEAVRAAEILKSKNINLAVYNLPWLNKINADWLNKETEQYQTLFTLDDHFLKLGQGSLIASLISQSGRNKKVIQLGLANIPECGQNQEVLITHSLDARSLTETINSSLIN